MLNLMRIDPTARRRVRQEILGVSGLGLLLGLMGIWHLENEAAQALAQALAQTSAMSSSIASVNASTDSYQAKPSRTLTQSVELAEAQQSAAANLERLVFLKRRQSQREDVTDVQETWLLSRLGSTPNRVKLQSQQWLQGQFSWEGVAAQPIDLDALVHNLSRFQRWHQAPTVVQMQSETTDASVGQRKALTFQLQAVLQPTTGEGL
jgi:hypothetical protein